jgi:hypothetical protein
LPVQSRMPVPACAEEALAELAAVGNLLECFAAVPDPRDPRDPAFPAVRTGLVHGRGAVREHDDRGRDRVGARRAAGGAGRGRGQAGRPRDARGAAPGDGGADLHRAGRTGAGGPCRGVPGPQRPARAPWPFAWPGRAGCPRSRRTGRRCAARPGKTGSSLPAGRRDRCSRTEPMACPRWRRRLSQPGLPPCSVVACRAGHAGTRAAGTHTRARPGGFHGRDRPPGARAWMPADTNRDGVRCLPLHSSR